jgi:hypothetical protein
MRLLYESNYPEAFKMLRVLGIGVMMQQMGHAGNVVKDSIRQEMRKSVGTLYKTRVSRDGKPYLLKGSIRRYGLRESMTIDNRDATPNSMEAMVKSFLMEKSQTLVVNGMMKRHTPFRYEGGERVGFEKTVDAVSRTTYAILNRMDMGTYIDGYDFKSRLSNKEIGRRYAKKGISNAMPKVNSILTNEFKKIYEKAVNNKHLKSKKAIYG